MVQELFPLRLKFKAPTELIPRIKSQTLQSLSAPGKDDKAIWNVTSKAFSRKGLTTMLEVVNSLEYWHVTTECEVSDAQ